MYHRQNSLGNLRVHENLVFDEIRIAQVNTVLPDGKLLVQVQDTGLSGGVLLPVLVTEFGVGITFIQGDWVLVGYINQSKSSPYLVAAVKDKYACGGMFKLDPVTGVEVNFKGNKIKIENGKVVIELAEEATIELGGTTAIARVGDPVTVDPETGEGTITGGSSKVKAG